MAREGYKRTDKRYGGCCHYGTNLSLDLTKLPCLVNSGTSTDAYFLINEEVWQSFPCSEERTFADCKDDIMIQQIIRNPSGITEAPS